MVQMPRFGLQGYRTLVSDIAAAGYRMVPTEDTAPSPACYLRHDVDTHLEGAGTIARIEADYGARSTWFVPVTFCFNVMHEPNRQVLRELVALGHHIGLHYDLEHTASLSDLHHQVRVLEAAAGTRVRSVSAHKPGHDKRALRQSAYQVPHHAEYVSDSARRWRDDRLMQLVHQRKDFMLLTHHEHWLSGEQDLMGYFSASVLPRTVRQAHAHAITTLNDCLSHT